MESVTEEFDAAFLVPKNDDGALLKLLTAANLGSTVKFVDSERPYEFQFNKTGTLKVANTTGNYTAKGYALHHVDMATHMGHLHSITIKTIQMANSSLHYEMAQSFGRFRSRNHTFEWAKMTKIDILRKNNDSSVSFVGNSTVRMAGQMNSTHLGGAVFETFYAGRDNMTGNIFEWMDHRNGTLNHGPGMVNSTSTGNGTVMAKKHFDVTLTHEEKSILSSMFMGAKHFLAANLTGHEVIVANFTDKSSSHLQIKPDFSPYSKNITETVVSRNHTFNSSDTGTGFMWRPEYLDKEHESYQIHLIDFIDILT